MINIRIVVVRISHPHIKTTYYYNQEISYSLKQMSFLQKFSMLSTRSNYFVDFVWKTKCTAIGYSCLFFPSLLQMRGKKKETKPVFNHFF